MRKMRIVIVSRGRRFKDVPKTTKLWIKWGEWNLYSDDGKMFTLSLQKNLFVTFYLAHSKSWEWDVVRLLIWYLAEFCSDMKIPDSLYDYRKPCLKIGSYFWVKFMTWRLLHNFTNASWIYRMPIFHARNS